MSGTSKLPAILKYPILHNFSDVNKFLNNHLCYILRRYENDGIAVIIVRNPANDDVTILFGDWAGNSVDLSAVGDNKYKDAALSFIDSDMSLFLKVMRLIKLDQAQFFFSFGPDGLILTDIQISINKLVGPGMVRDIFGSNYRVPEIVKIEVIDERASEYISKGLGSYEGDLIIKPSKFLTFSDKSMTLPLYVEVKR